MNGNPSPARPAEPARPAPLAKRLLGYPARMILGTFMSLAVMLLERRIRKALRSR